MEIESLNKTWFVDVDGTILYHHSNNSLDELIERYGSESYKHETPIENSINFFQSLPEDDVIIIATAREKRHIDHTLNVLEYIGMPFNQWIFELGCGPRIVVNDIKPPGWAGNSEPLQTAYGMNLERDHGIVDNITHYNFLKKVNSIK